MEGLKPHPHLKNLCVTRYGGFSAPSWLDKDYLCCLRSLYVTDCRALTVLPPLGMLPSLKVLCLAGLTAVKLIGSEFYGSKDIAFPCLNVLEFRALLQWTKWSSGTNRDVFPRLQVLKILGCLELRDWPTAPPTVKSLTIKGTPAIGDVQLFGHPSGGPSRFYLEDGNANFLVHELLGEAPLQLVEVFSINNSVNPLLNLEPHMLRALNTLSIWGSSITNDQLSMCLRKFTASLYKLEITDCEALTSFPVPESSCAATLKELALHHCEMLSSLVALENLMSLRVLTVDSCPKLTVASLPSNFRSLRSLMELTVSCCAGLDSLPAGGLPPSLKLVELTDCHPTLTRALKDKAGPEWEKLTFVPEIIL